jgi:hypothetical protein
MRARTPHDQLKNKHRDQIQRLLYKMNFNPTLRFPTLKTQTT